MADKLTLRQLRERQGVTQVQMAERLGIAQESVSRMERARGIKLETMARYVGGLGGRLEVHAVFDDERISIGTIDPG